MSDSYQFYKIAKNFNCIRDVVERQRQSANCQNVSSSVDLFEADFYHKNDKTVPKATMRNENKENFSDCDKVRIYYDLPLLLFNNLRLNGADAYRRPSTGFISEQKIDTEFFDDCCFKSEHLNSLNSVSNFENNSSKKVINPVSFTRKVIDISDSEEDCGDYVNNNYIEEFDCDLASTADNADDIDSVLNFSFSHNSSSKLSNKLPQKCFSNDQLDKNNDHILIFSNESNQSFNQPRPKINIEQISNEDLNCDILCQNPANVPGPKLTTTIEVAGNEKCEYSEIKMKSKQIQTVASNQQVMQKQLHIANEDKLKSKRCHHSSCFYDRGDIQRYIIEKRRLRAKVRHEEKLRKQLHDDRIKRNMQNLRDKLSTVIKKDLPKHVYQNRNKKIVPQIGNIEKFETMSSGDEFEKVEKYTEISFEHFVHSSEQINMLQTSYFDPPNNISLFGDEFEEEYKQLPLLTCSKKRNFLICNKVKLITQPISVNPNSVSKSHESHMDDLLSKSGRLIHDSLIEKAGHCLLNANEADCSLCNECDNALQISFEAEQNSHKNNCDRNDMPFVSTKMPTSQYTNDLYNESDVTDSFDKQLSRLTVPNWDELSMRVFQNKSSNVSSPKGYIGTEMLTDNGLCHSKTITSNQPERGLSTNFTRSKQLSPLLSDDQRKCVAKIEFSEPSTLDNILRLTSESLSNLKSAHRICTESSVDIDQSTMDSLSSISSDLSVSEFSASFDANELNQNSKSLDNGDNDQHTKHRTPETIENVDIEKFVTNVASRIFMLRLDYIEQKKCATDLQNAIKHSQFVVDFAQTPYRLFLFDLCKEIIMDMFVIDTSTCIENIEMTLMVPLRMQKQLWPTDQQTFINLLVERVDSMLHLQSNLLIDSLTEPPEQSPNQCNNIGTNRMARQLIKRFGLMAYCRMQRKMNFIDSVLYQEMLQDEPRWIYFGPEIKEIKSLLSGVKLDDDETIQNLITNISYV